MESHDVQTTLTGALGTSGPQLVAFVGAGGKTGALQRLCTESPSKPGGILATTTTAMFARQLSAVGPLLVEDDGETPLATRAAQALRSAGVVALARSHAENEKVKGLAPAEVDALWREGVAGTIVVEADGSRGLPLKAFGEAEPQLPSATTTVVVVAGLDALGLPLDEEHVHRATLLLPLLGAADGDSVTPRLFAAALALQITRVRALTPQARVVVLLNKAENDKSTRQAASVAGELLAASSGGRGHAAPARIVIGSLRRNWYSVDLEADA